MTGTLIYLATFFGLYWLTEKSPKLGTREAANDRVARHMLRQYRQVKKEGASAHSSVKPGTKSGSS